MFSSGLVSRDHRSAIPLIDEGAAGPSEAVRMAMNAVKTAVRAMSMMKLCMLLRLLNLVEMEVMTLVGRRSKR
jgi:hypothetical protein